MDKKIGKYIKKLRIARGITCDAMADISGMSRSSYFAVKRGTKALTLEEAYYIAYRLDVALDDFVALKPITVTIPEKKIEVTPDL